MTKSDPKKTEHTLKAQARAAAEQKLRAAHQNEFWSLYQAECEARGVEFTRRLTAEEKAAAQLEKLLAEFPHLKDKIGG